MRFCRILPPPRPRPRRTGSTSRRREGEVTTQLQPPLSARPSTGVFLRRFSLKRRAGYWYTSGYCLVRHLKCRGLNVTHHRAFAETIVVATHLVAFSLGGTSPQAVAQPAGLAPGDTYQLMFVTSRQSVLVADTMVPPASVLQWGGIAAADWVATWHAQSGNISAAEFGLSPNEFVTGDADTSWDFESTPWQAMLSDSTTDAIDRLNIVGPVYNMNSQLVATSKADLFDGTLTAPIRFNELGNSISNNFQVWTGTNADGSWSGASAGAWNNPSEAASATVGDATKISPAWTTSTTIPASGLARLYALSPVFTVPLAGDFNDNGVVDLADYTVWRDNLALSTKTL